MVSFVAKGKLSQQALCMLPKPQSIRLRRESSKLGAGAAKLHIQLILMARYSALSQCRASGAE